MADIQELSLTFVDGVTPLNATNMNAIVGKINEIVRATNAGSGGGGGATAPSAPTITISGNNATITAVSGATIKYTLDGSTPSASNGTTYSGVISLGNTEKTIKAVAIKDGLVSSVATKKYIPTMEPSEPPVTTTDLDISDQFVFKDDYMVIADESNANYGHGSSVSYGLKGMVVSNRVRIADYVGKTMKISLPYFKRSSETATTGGICFFSNASSADSVMAGFPLPLGDIAENYLEVEIQEGWNYVAATYLMDESVVGPFKCIIKGVEVTPADPNDLASKLTWINGQCMTTAGAQGTNAYLKLSEPIDVSTLVGKTINFSCVKGGSTTAIQYRYALYFSDAEDAKLSGGKSILYNSEYEDGWEDYDIVVPEGAKYARFGWWKDGLGFENDFYAKIKNS